MTTLYTHTGKLYMIKYNIVYPEMTMLYTKTHTLYTFSERLSLPFHISYHAFLNLSSHSLDFNNRTRKQKVEV